jgi:Flp pilus assembly protein TadD
MAQFTRPRCSMVFALLVTTAAAPLLGACSQTNKLFSRNKSLTEVKMSPLQAAGATQRWAAAYASKPKDPQTALGYAMSLRAIGAKDRSFEILNAAYRTDPSNGEVAAELGRVALETGRIDIATRALKSAESQGVTDWRMLSAQGTLHAKKGEHAQAQQYYRAALEKNPEAGSVTNNLALSYALDGKAKESEALLREATANGQDDKRIRQNLALVLGVQGKYDEARQVASVDMTEAQAKSSMSYLHNMLDTPTQVAAAPKAAPSVHASAEDWSPFASNAPVSPHKPIKAAAKTAPAPRPAKVQVVTPVDDIQAPAKIAQAPTSLLRTKID